MSEPERCLGESDWEDLDLLTTGEATYRLDQDIAALRSSLNENPDDTRSRNRLALLVEARQRMSSNKSRTD